MVQFSRHETGELSQDQDNIKCDPNSPIKVSWVSSPTSDVIELSLAPDAAQDVQFAGGKIVVDADGFVKGTEIADPAAPAANNGVLYFRDNGSGKTQLVVRFPTGAVQVIATEPA